MQTLISSINNTDNQYMSYRALAVAACILAMPAALPNQTQAAAFSTSTSCLPRVLKHRLAQVRAKFGKVKVISTYRRGAKMRGTNKPSHHANCHAVDFKVAHKWAAYKWLSRVHKGGVGVYSGRCNHIHIDDGYNLSWHKKGC